MGLMPGYTPAFHPEPTAEATIPMWQNNGDVKYITPKDLKWLIDENLIDASIVDSI